MTEPQRIVWIFLKTSDLLNKEYNQRLKNKNQLCFVENQQNKIIFIFYFSSVFKNSSPNITKEEIKWLTHKDQNICPLKFLLLVAFKDTLVINKTSFKFCSFGLFKAKLSESYQAIIILIGKPKQLDSIIFYFTFLFVQNFFFFHTSICPKLRALISYITHWIKKSSGFWPKQKNYIKRKLTKTKH